MGPADVGDIGPSRQRYEIWWPTPQQGERTGKILVAPNGVI